ncbi:MAG: 3-isopropylmalate dehydratase [Methanomassiliicoccaceae archaeon]|nr:3-isopropylmalate dehydratase [Methanomassiliicoccaceae archaeon]
MMRITGRIWRFGDHVDTDQILPAERLVSENLTHLNDFIFEKVRPGISSEVKKGDIIVAGKNFGCGSSREHAPRALMQAGVACVIAESFARIFFRNSINIGLPVIECRVGTKEGGTVTVSTDDGIITDGIDTFNFPGYPEFISELISKGGLMAKIRSGTE